jgi:hypothetical protein
VSIYPRQLRITVVIFGLFVAQTAMAEASATTTATDDGDYAYQFTDEALLGDTLGNVGDMYRGRPRFNRVLLIRPASVWSRNS